MSFYGSVPLGNVCFDERFLECFLMKLQRFNLNFYGVEIYWSTILSNYNSIKVSRLSREIKIFCPFQKSSDYMTRDYNKKQNET